MGRKHKSEGKENIKVEGKKI